jgi:hypothetical protein
VLTNLCGRVTATQAADVAQMSVCLAGWLAGLAPHWDRDVAKGAMFCFSVMGFTFHASSVKTE